MDACEQLVDAAFRDHSFGRNVSAFLSHRTFHHQNQEDEPKRQYREHPKAVEISECRCLLLAQVREFLPGELLSRDRIGGLLEEEFPSLPDEGLRGRVEGVEILAKAQAVELVTPLIEGLGCRGSDAAALVAQKAQ